MRNLMTRRRAVVRVGALVASLGLMLGVSTPNCVPSGSLLDTGTTPATSADAAATEQTTGGAARAGDVTTLDGSQISLDQLDELLQRNDGRTYVVVFVTPGVTQAARAGGSSSNTSDGNSGSSGNSGSGGSGSGSGSDFVDSATVDQRIKAALSLYVPRGEVDSISTDMIQSAAVTDAKIATVSPKQLSPQGAGSGLDADTLQGYAPSNFTPIPGEVRLWAGTIATVPKGWLPCDGRSVSRTQYILLFAAIGTIYGTGDGKSTFNLPDFRDRVPMGASVDRKGYPLTTVEGKGSQTGGAATHTLTVAELPAHHHDMTHTHDMPTRTGGSSTNAVSAGNSGTPGTLATNGPSTTLTGDTGSGAAHSILNPYFAITYIIYGG